MRNAARSSSLPVDWVEQTIGQFCTVKTGPFGTLLKASEYSELEGVPVISVGEVREGYLRVTEHTPLVPEAVQRRLPQYILQAGDVVFGRKGAVERSALVRQPQSGWFLGSDGIAVRPKGEHCPEYVAAQFQSFRVRQWLSMNSTGTTMASMNQEVLSRAAIPFPPTLAEERSIADALTDADALIDSLEQLLTKKRQIKQGAMQELLTGKRRLPGFTGQWSETTLFDLAERRKDLFDDGDWIESEHIRSKGIRLIQTGNIGVGRFIEKEDKKYIDDRSFSLLRCKELRVGDLLICRLADPAGRACVLPNMEDDRVVTSVDVTIFRPPSDTASREFLEQVFSQPQWFKAVSELSGGTTHKRIARGALGRMEITLPGLAEQAAIAEVLSDMDAEIITIESRLTKARALKQAMAQALLTGRIRLVEPAA